MCVCVCVCVCGVCAGLHASMCRGRRYTVQYRVDFSCRGRVISDREIKGARCAESVLDGAWDGDQLFVCVCGGGGGGVAGWGGVARK